MCDKCTESTEPPEGMFWRVRKEDFGFGVFFLRIDLRERRRWWKINYSRYVAGGTANPERFLPEEEISWDEAVRRAKIDILYTIAHSPPSNDVEHLLEG